MSNNNYSENETTFWEFISDYKIEIPIVQRDYAQGRLGEEYLRKSFLTNLKQALDGDLPNGEKKLKLDFVYGSTEQGKMHQKNKMLPLDGQQRLTTLWLLHWYIALMAEKLNEDTCKCLNKFSYETRITSREFCKELCNPNNFTDFYKYKPDESRRIVSYIKSRTWFYSAWNQDPTIQSMLRMLGGTKITNKKGEDILDGIEELFEGTDIDKFNDYCENLISPNNAPIVFYHLPLKDFGLSDDLYIKMNARGKQLTSFENFKADLNGYIKQQAKNEVLDKEQQNKWGKLLDPKEGIPILMDTKWTDIFWEHKSTKSNIDEIYFAFLNRFFLCELICQKGNNDYIYSAEGLEKKNSTFRHLYGKESNDANIEYVGWEMYGDIPLAYFNDLNTALDNHIENFQEFFPDWAKKDSQLQFIPGYKEDNAITTLTQSERVAFHAISKYLQKGKFDKIKFRQWMRVVWNIVENANINSIATMIGAMRLIDELGEHSHEIYEFLANEKSEIKSEAVKGQVKEEIDKAKQILNGTKRQDDKSWEEIIIEAENYAFFKGSIRFLYQDAEGKTNWDNFDTKWANAQNYFDKNGVKDNYKVDLTKALVVQCDNWGEQLYDTQIFNPNANTWKWILCSEIWKTPINNILIDLKNIQCSQSLNDDNANKNITPILNNLPYKTFIEEEPTGRFRFIEDRLAYYKPYGRRYIIFDWNNFSRNKTLRELKKVLSIDNSRNPVIDNSALSFWWGWNIYFKFQNCFFLWSGNPNNVYLMLDCWNDYKKREPTIDSVQDKDKYYCFKVEGDMTSEAFIKELDKLIEQAKQDNPANNDSGSSESGETQES